LVSGRQSTPDDAKAVSALHVSLNLNLAASYIAVNDWPKAIEYSTRALSLDADNAKAHFRRGSAYSAVGDLDSAESDLQRALALSGGSDAAISRALAALKAQRKVADEKQRAQFKGMFDKHV